MTNTCLSRQNICRDKKMILVAAPANGREPGWVGEWGWEVGLWQTLVLNLHWTSSDDSGQVPVLIPDFQSRKAVEIAPGLRGQRPQFREKDGEEKEKE